jgi:hypothetical protein
MEGRSSLVPKETTELDPAVWTPVEPGSGVASKHSPRSIDADEFTAKILLRCDGSVNAVCLALKIPVERADNDPMMAIGRHGNADASAFPARARTARHFQRRKPLKMKEPGNHVFRLRPIFGQDAQ